MTCQACGWSDRHERGWSYLVCPSCDAELPQNEPCRCDVCQTTNQRRRQYADGSPRLEASQMAQEALPDHLCPTCVQVLRARFYAPQDAKQAAERWWAEELARLAPAGSWGELRAAIIDASNKVLRLTQLMEEEEKQ